MLTFSLYYQSSQRKTNAERPNAEDGIFVSWSEVSLLGTSFQFSLRWRPVLLNQYFLDLFCF